MSRTYVRSTNQDGAFVWRFPRGETRPTKRFASFSIIGKYSDEVAGFVKHAALLAADSEITSLTDVPVWHMGPPISATESAKCRADVVVEIPLSIDERNAMLHWRSIVEKELRPTKRFEQYTISPPIVWVRSELGRPMYRRFSCAGFVMSCYSSAEIDILAEESMLPEVSSSEVELAYSDFQRVAISPPEVRSRIGFVSIEDLGISGPGPWRLTLAGYLFHSLKRLSDDSPRLGPYTPASVDEMYYPERPQQLPE
jgi:hypothetical protein